MENWLHQVEQACFRLEQTDAGWLAGVRRALQPVLDADRLGIASGFFDCPDPCSLSPELIVGPEFDPQLQEILLYGISTLSPEYVAATFLSGGMGPGSQYRDWTAIAPVRDGSLASLGIADTCAIRVADLDGTGVWFVAFRVHSFQLSHAEWRAYARAQRTIALAWRMRKERGVMPVTVEHADFAFDELGRLVHLMSPCVAAHSLTPARDLAAASLAQDARAAGTLRLGGDGCMAMFAHHEPDGRRYAVAMRSRRMAPSLNLLSARERDVLSRAVSGTEPKAIAYDLGLAHSTVRVLLARAAKKLGAQSKRDLFEKASSLKQDAAALG